MDMQDNIVQTQRQVKSMKIDSGEKVLILYYVCVIMNALILCEL